MTKGFSEQTHDNLILYSNAFDFLTLAKKQVVNHQFSKHAQAKPIQVMGRNSLALTRFNRAH